MTDIRTGIEPASQPQLESQTIPSPDIDLNVRFGMPEIVDESVYPHVIKYLYALGYYAAVFEHQLDPYLHDTDRRSPNFGRITGIRPFTPPTVQDALNAYNNPVKLNGSRWRANYMAGRVLRAIIVQDEASGTEVIDDQLFNAWYGPGAGMRAFKLYEGMVAKRHQEALQATAALEAPQPGTTETDAAPLNSTENERAVWSQQELKKAILAEYEDGFRDLFDASAKRVDLSRLPEDQKISAARLLAGIQNAIYDHLAETGKLPEGAVYISEEDAKQILLQPGFIDEAGGIRVGKFSRRARTLPILGKNSLDMQFRKPGLTRTAVDYALEATYPQDEERASTRPRTIGEAWELSQRRVAVAQPEITDEPIGIMSPEEEAVFDQFGGIFEDSVRSRFGDLLIDSTTLRKLFYAACISDNEYDGGFIYDGWKPSNSGRISNRTWWLDLRKEMRAILHADEAVEHQEAAPPESDDLFAGEGPDPSLDDTNADELETGDVWNTEADELAGNGGWESEPDESPGSVGPRLRAQTNARALHTTGQRVAELPPEPPSRRRWFTRLKSAMSRPRRAS